MTKMRTKRTIAVLTAIFALLSVVSCKKAPRPNVVVILIDTLRADRLPFYGYPKVTTPFLNELASRSTVFEQAFAGSSWTAPATASIFTGLYPFQHGVVMGLAAQLQIIKKDPNIKINRIPDNVLTMPEVFKANGYRTFTVADNANISRAQGFHQGFDRMVCLSHRGAPAVNSEVLKLEREIKGKTPYFLYIHYNDPHKPYKLALAPGEGNGERIHDQKLVYDKELALVDASIRELFQRFGWKRDTLVVVTADHGEEMFERGFYGHGRTLFNTVIHVPLLFFYPESGRVQGGRVPGPVSTLDILPTLSSLLRFGKLRDVAGIDLAPQLRDPGQPAPQRPIFSHLHLKASGRDDVVHKASLFANYKYIYQSNAETSQFFDLAKDFSEQRNLYSGRTAQANKLAARYFQFERSCKRFNPGYVDIQLDDKSIEHLKTLGYIQ
jgi:arylsulfatase A-like enzyme